MQRYTAEYRGGDWKEKPWEWCVVDEESGWCGSTILFDLTEEQAKDKAREMNTSLEVKNRIKVALAAYAYEVDNKPVISDSEFDQLCLNITPSLSTGHSQMDKFFRDEFTPDTGIWVHQHPEKGKLKLLLEKYYYNKAKFC